MEYHLKLECKHVFLSPDRSYIACKNHAELFVFNAISTEIITTFPCPGNVRTLLWSPSSDLLLCAVHHSPTLAIWSIFNPKWSCSINCDNNDAHSFLWAPDSTSLISISNLNLRASVYSLELGTTVFIKYLKCFVSPVARSDKANCVDGKSSGGSSCRRALSFSADGSRLVAVEQRAGYDFISVFSTGQQPWSLVKNLDVQSRQLGGVQWTPDSAVFCVYDDWRCFRLSLFSVTCILLSELEVTESPLGVDSVQWSPDSQLLAVCGYDGKVRLISRRHWTVLTSVGGGGRVFGDRSLTVYMQQTTLLTGYQLQLALSSASDVTNTVQYEVVNERPVLLKAATVDSMSSGTFRHNTFNTIVKYSADNRYLASWCSSNADCLWLWNLAYNLSLSTLIIQQAPITDFCWSPDGCQLLVCTGSRHVGVWCAKSDPITITGPSELNFHQVRWLAQRNCFVLASENHVFCCSSKTGETHRQQYFLSEKHVVR